MENSQSSIFALNEALNKVVIGNSDVKYQDDLCNKIMTEFVAQMLPPGQYGIYKKLKPEPMSPRDVGSALKMKSKQTRYPIMCLERKGLVETWRSEQGFFYVKKKTRLFRRK